MASKPVSHAPVSATPALLPRIDRRIVVLRGLRLMIDADLAAFYGVTTKRLDEQPRRPPKFPHLWPPQTPPPDRA